MASLKSARADALKTFHKLDAMMHGRFPLYIRCLAVIAEYIDGTRGPRLSSQQATFLAGNLSAGLRRSTVWQHILKYLSLTNARHEIPLNANVVFGIGKDMKFWDDLTVGLLVFALYKKQPMQSIDARYFQLPVVQKTYAGFVEYMVPYAAREAARVLTTTHPRVQFPTYIHMLSLLRSLDETPAQESSVKGIDIAFGIHLNTNRTWRSIIKFMSQRNRRLARAAGNGRDMNYWNAVTTGLLVYGLHRQYARDPHTASFAEKFLTLDGVKKVHTAYMQHMSRRVRFTPGTKMFNGR